MSFSISSVQKGITGAYNQTISDPNYFNTLWGVTDSVVTEIPDPTPDEIAAQIAAQQAAQLLAQQRAPILAQLLEIDQKKIRCMSDNVLGNSVTINSVTILATDYLIQLESQAVSLRAQLATLQ